MWMQLLIHVFHTVYGKGSRPHEVREETTLYTDLCHNFTGILVNSSPSGQNGRHFADDSFKGTFMNEKVFISIRISLKFVPKGSINNNPA